ncbi:hypothetical protein C0992_001574, partial [Termitomyces sp. T32_za158]
VMHFLSDDQQRLELFKFATKFRTHQALQQSQTDYATIKTIMERVENALDHSISFTESQKNTIRMVTRLKIWEHDRTNYSNPIIIAVVRAYLKKHSETNGFKDYFNDDEQTQSRTKAFKSTLGREASYIKAQLRNIKEGVTGRGINFTTNFIDATHKFLRASDVPDVQHGIHFLIMRAFAWANPKLVDEFAESSSSISEVDIEMEDWAPASNAKKRKTSDKSTSRMPTGSAAKGTDFFSELTQFFKEKERLWGTNVRMGGWVDYVEEAIKKEEDLFPDDKLPIIPRCAALPVLAPVINTPTSTPSRIDSLHMHTTHPREVFLTEFQDGYDGSKSLRRLNKWCNGGTNLDSWFAGS